MKMLRTEVLVMCVGLVLLSNIKDGWQSTFAYLAAMVAGGIYFWLLFKGDKK